MTRTKTITTCVRAFFCDTVREQEKDAHMRQQLCKCKREAEAELQTDNEIEREGKGWGGGLVGEFVECE